MTQGFVVFLAFCYFACLFLAFFVLYLIFESWQSDDDDDKVSKIASNATLLKKAKPFYVAHCLDIKRSSFLVQSPQKVDWPHEGERRQGTGPRVPRRY